MTIGIRQRGRRGPDPRALRSSVIALASTVVVFGGLGWIIVHAPGCPQVQASFLNRAVFEEWQERHNA